MDAPEKDREVALQKAGSGWLLDIQKALPKFLYRKDPDGGAQQPRQFVRQTTTTELVNLLEPFQEWPQLLDPHLNALVTPLADAFLQCIARNTSTRQPHTESASGLVIPLECAICRLLYTLCKIRGAKTITRFFQNEARYLEPMLDAFQSSKVSSEATGGESLAITLTWEEKYINLLWLSHLLLTPFDLSTVGSSRGQHLTIDMPGLSLPATLPGIARRMIEETLAHLSSPSKEREAAVKLLARLSLRPDMQKIGLHSTLIQWSITQLEIFSKAADIQSPYGPLGFLSLVAEIVVSADASVIFPHLLPIFKNIRSLSPSNSSSDSDVVSSAVARKVVIKIYRAITLAALQLEALPERLSPINVSEYVLEEVIDYLLTSLADKDTPVRYAASKAISMITIKLDPELAAEITEAVTSSLAENVLWDDASQLAASGNDKLHSGTKPRNRNLSAVNPLRWHGLVLTLAQLLFQRSPPPSQLPPILNSLIIALDFEQRGSSGTSIGANVRDAANFGIWSLARRYSTQELSAVEVSAIKTGSTSLTGKLSAPPSSVIQILAAELVAAATLDPSGNIRRGASAALQELIGRHPDTVAEGIGIVQVVDYHAVALRQRAFETVAVDAAKLDPIYWDNLLDHLLSWRGISAADAPSRRYAARTIGFLSRFQSWRGWQTAGASVWSSLELVRRQDVERRHGLLLALRAIIEASWNPDFSQNASSSSREAFLKLVMNYFRADSPFQDRDLTMSTLRPELTAEAVTSLISSLASTRKQGLMDAIPTEIEQRCLTLINLSLSRREDVVISCASNAAKDLLSTMTSQKQTGALSDWIQRLDLNTQGATSGSKVGMLSALGAIFPIFASTDSETTHLAIWEALLNGLDPHKNSNISTRVAALSSIDRCIPHAAVLPQNVITALHSSLEDYTTDSRGDIGSLIRLGAISATSTALQSHKIPSGPSALPLLSSLVCLAAEKLDKVRLRAWTCLRLAWPSYAPNLDPNPNPTSTPTSAPNPNSNPTSLPLSPSFPSTNQTSTPTYFTSLLTLLSTPPLRRPLLRGYITSAGTGSESVLQASRAALATHLRALTQSQRATFAREFLGLFEEVHAHERLAVPALDTLAWVLQSGTLGGLGKGSGAGAEEGLGEGEVDWRGVFGVVQRAHFRSGSVGRLTGAVDVYMGLVGVVGGKLRGEVLRKLVSLLLHPYPRVRNRAADALWVRTGLGGLVGVDWSRGTRELKPVVEGLRRELEVG